MILNCKVIPIASLLCFCCVSSYATTESSDVYLLERAAQYENDAHALTQLEDAAKVNDPNAQAWLGVYVAAQGDYLQAVDLFNKAAKRGNTLAIDNLARLYYQGHGVSQDNEQSMRLFRQAAELGDIEAIETLTYKAAQGNVYAEYILNLMYDKQHALGEGQNINSLLVAAGKGDAYSQLKLAWMYQVGEGVSADQTTALQWFTKSANAGNARAQYTLGWMYENGIGVSEDPSSAVRWYRKAADQGYADAETGLGAYYDLGKGVAWNAQQAFEWYKKAAERNDANGQNRMGVEYNLGRAVTSDSHQAIQWYRKAAEQGDPSALFNLSDMYRNGKGVMKNVVIAYALYDLSVINSSEQEDELDRVREVSEGRMTSDEVRTGDLLVRRMQKYGVLETIDAFVTDTDTNK